MPSNWRHATDPRVYLHGLQNRLMLPVRGASQEEELRQSLRRSIETGLDENGIAEGAEEMARGLREAADSPESGRLVATGFADLVVGPMGTMLLELMVERLGQRPTVPHAVGGITLGTPDALVLQTPGGGAVVAVTSGLLTFANLLAKLVASVIPVTERDEGLEFGFDPEEIQARAEASSEVHERFIDLFSATLAAGGAGQARPYLLGGPAMGLAEVLREGAERFVLAAQMATGLLGPQDTNTFVRHRLAPGVEVLRLVPDRLRTLRSDGVALRLLFESASNEGPAAPLYHFGVDVFLGAWGLLEALQGHPTDPSDTFAPAVFRRGMLRRALLESWGDGASGLLQRASAGDALLGFLWERNQDALVARIEERRNLEREPSAPPRLLPEAQQVVDSISARLTGDHQADMRFLVGQMEEHRDHRHGRAIVREIGRLMAGVVPEDTLQEGMKAYQSDLRNRKAREDDVQQKLREGDLAGAETVLCTLLPVDGPGFDSDATEVHLEFGEPLEEMFHRIHGREKRRVRRPFFSFLRSVELMVELRRRQGDAMGGLRACDHLQELNPVSCLAFARRAEFHLAQGQLVRALEDAARAHSLAFKPALLGLCHRVFGECCLHRQDRGLAAACFVRSLSYQDTAEARRGLEVALQGSSSPAPPLDAAVAMLDAAGMPGNPNGQWVELANGVARALLRDGKVLPALECLEIVHGMIPSDSLASLIAELRTEVRRPKEGREEEQPSPT